jgi:hypothetical protein
MNEDANQLAGCAVSPVEMARRVPNPLLGFAQTEAERAAAVAEFDAHQAARLADGLVDPSELAYPAGRRKHK